MCTGWLLTLWFGPEQLVDSGFLQLFERKLLHRATGNEFEECWAIVVTLQGSWMLKFTWEYIFPGFKLCTCVRNWNCLLRSYWQLGVVFKNKTNIAELETGGNSLRVTFHMQDCYIMYECIFQNVPLSLCNTDNTYNQPDQVTSYTHTGTLYYPSNSPNKQLNYFSAALCWTSNLPFPPLCVLSL